MIAWSIPSWNTSNTSHWITIVQIKRVFIKIPSIGECRYQTVLGSVKEVFKVFMNSEHSCSKIDKITKLFDKSENLKNQKVTYWTERNRPAYLKGKLYNCIILHSSYIFPDVLYATLLLLCDMSILMGTCIITGTWPMGSGICVQVFPQIWIRPK